MRRKNLHSARIGSNPGIFFIFALLTIAVTYPLIWKMSSAAYGFMGDSFGAIWHSWWIKYQPFPIDFSGSIRNFFWEGLLRLFLFAFDEIFTYNLIVLMSFFLSAITMFYLVDYLTRNKLAAMFSGIIYAFCPYHFVHSYQHLTLANIQWMPLYVLTLLKLNETKTFRSAIFCGMAFSLVFLSDYYYGYFMGIFTALFILFAGIYNWHRQKVRIKDFKIISVAILVALIIILPFTYHIFKILLSASRTVLEQTGGIRPLSDLLIFSARPLDYLIPSKYNPFLGRFIPDLGISIWRGHRYIEHTLFLGYIPLILAGIALRNNWKRKKIIAQRERFAISFFAFAVLAGVLISAPPFLPLGHFSIDTISREVICRHKLFLPSYFLYKIAPMFRCYARFGIIVMLSVSVLAGFGLKFILEKTESRQKKIGLFILLSSLLFIEFADFPPFRITDVHKPPAVYQWLSQQPGNFAIIEYPLAKSNDSSAFQEYVFWQRVHQKRLINGCPDRLNEEIRKKIIDISNPEILSTLTGLGARYVIVHQDKYRKGNIYIPFEWLTTPPRYKIYPSGYNNGRVPVVADGLELVKRFGETLVYKIKK
ncbi:MAG: YfhO family protein [Candidatus Omnitrophica bacterium]|nr:YfhO family protein [Candidatus Omnitrophota bacterium]